LGEAPELEAGMTTNRDIVFTAAARRAQAERGSGRMYEKRAAAGFPDRVTTELAAFIAALDTAFLATVSAAGAPYIQHRGGPKGFIKVLDDRTLGFADYAGNRQYITIGNLAENDRAYLFLLDFAARRRIKVWGRARVVENDPALLARLADPGYRARPERAILFTVEAWDVNCTQHITARFTESEVADATTVLRERIAALEAENARLRAGSVQDGLAEGKPAGA
jgi:predicted pyridoxine 5'-phosphate oxidase superfamily flavin-nucleotide-binding protein